MCIKFSTWTQDNCKSYYFNSISASEGKGTLRNTKDVHTRQSHIFMATNKTQIENLSNHTRRNTNRDLVPAGISAFSSGFMLDSSYEGIQQVLLMELTFMVVHFLVHYHLNVLTAI